MKPGRGHTIVAGMALLVAGSLAPAHGGGKTDLEGSWVQRTLEVSGEKKRPEPDTRLSITGSKFEITVGGKLIAAGTIQLNPKTRPMSIDTTYTVGPNRGKRFRGIYELKGDRVTFCRAGTEEMARPTAFVTKPGSGYLMSLYQRQRR